MHEILCRQAFVRQLIFSKNGFSVPGAVKQVNLIVLTDT